MHVNIKIVSNASDPTHPPTTNATDPIQHEEKHAGIDRSRIDNSFLHKAVLDGMPENLVERHDFHLNTQLRPTQHHGHDENPTMCKEKWLARCQSSLASCRSNKWL